MKMTKTDWKKKLREICTYHNDDGTSGYCLSDEQFKELDQLFSQEFRKNYQEGKDDQWNIDLELFREQVKKRDKS